MSPFNVPTTDILWRRIREERAEEVEVRDSNPWVANDAR